MDTQQILEALNEQGRLPVEAIRAARDDRLSITSVFLKNIDDFVTSGRAEMGPDALFIVFHLLGEWREQSAYRPLANLLQLPDDVLEPMLSGAKTETVHRVMAAVFDGDPAPLHAIIRAEGADEYIRSRMIHALAMLTMSGQIARAQTAEFLRDCYDQLRPQQDCYVWCGWQEAVAWLGLVELKPLVREAFSRGFIHPGWLSFADFETDLNHSLAHPDAGPLHSGEKLTPFGDTIAELEHWACFQPEDKKASTKGIQHRLLSSFDDPPVRNPLRGVGRNDPCPCGSGKKFKKCCIGVDPDTLIERISALSNPD